MDAYLGRCGQCTQRQISIWVDLCMISSQTRSSLIGSTYVGNSLYYVVENAKGLQIGIAEGV